MSAIGGILGLDGAPLDLDALARLGRSLARRGPDGGREIVEGPVAMAYRAFFISNESRAARPARSSRGVILAWDGRLDNAAALRQELSLSAEEASCDEDIVLAAYERWPEDFLRRLIGDFALSLWDPRARALTLARDPFAVRPLFYRQEPGRILWATRIAAILEAAAIPPAPDDAWIGGYLTYSPNHHGTPFQGIWAVPAGHRLVVTDKGSALTRFWAHRPEQAIRYATDAEYEAHFRALFMESVRARTRVEGPIFAELSGGMDSSSVACMAQRLIAEGATTASALHTASFVFESSRTADERGFIRVVEGHLGKPGLHVGEDALVMPALDTPCTEVPTETHCFRRQYDRVGEAMQAAGARVLLTGFAGDAVLWGEVGPPLEVADHLRQGNLRALVRGLGTFRAVQQKPYVQLLWEGGIRPLLPGFLRRLTRPSHPVPPWIAPAFARKHNLRRRRHDPYGDGGFALPSQRDHFAAIQSDIDVVSWHYCCNGAKVMDVAHPYLHRPLVEFCMSVPLEQHVRGHETRSLHRRALRGILPERVRRRLVKQGPDEAIHRAIAKQWPRIEELLDGARVVDRGYVADKPLRDALQMARFGRNPGLLLLRKALALEYWLRAIETGNLGPD